MFVSFKLQVYLFVMTSGHVLQYSQSSSSLPILYNLQGNLFQRVLTHKGFVLLRLNYMFSPKPENLYWIISYYYLWCPRDN